MNTMNPLAPAKKLAERLCTKPMTKRRVRRIAVHEAAHAVVGVALGRRLGFVHIYPSAPDDNNAMTWWENEPRDWSLADIRTVGVSTLAGVATETADVPEELDGMLRGELDHDINKALDLATHHVALTRGYAELRGNRVEPLVKRLPADIKSVRNSVYDQWHHYAERLVEERWSDIERLADALQERRSMTGDEVVALLSAA